MVIHYMSSSEFFVIEKNIYLKCIYIAVVKAEEYISGNLSKKFFLTFRSDKSFKTIIEIFHQ
jgi:hypothetical protein